MKFWCLKFSKNPNEINLSVFDQASKMGKIKKDKGTVQEVPAFHDFRIGDRCYFVIHFQGLILWNPRYYVILMHSEKIVLNLIHQYSKMFLWILYGKT